ncbi:MAG: UDP-N-acetylmuramoyl-L-alanine--D-glutamate ligase [Calditrichaeota bacterium]|nr:UDP-N-acetylmuramoyl-L-alanine--D-glutamate ligase [Calditrichota bacterium]
MIKLSFSGQRIVIVGMARSGIGAAKLIKRLGGKVLVSDQKTKDELMEAVSHLEAQGIETETGHHRRAETEKWDLAVVSPGVSANHPLLRDFTMRAIPVWSELELATRALRCPWVGITGSNGKTTTTVMTGAIFREDGRRTEVAGNIGRALSELALDLPTKAIVVVEVSSFQLEFSPSVKPAAAAFLNLTPDHLDRHGTMEAYRTAKSRLLANQDSNDFFVANFDDPYVRELAQYARAQVIPFGFNLNRGVTLRNGDIVFHDGTTCREVMAVRDLPLPGRHNLANAMAAIGICCSMGVAPDIAGQALRKLSPIEHRLELVRELREVKYYNDSKATNVDATITALQSFSGPILLIAGGRGKGGTFEALRPYLRHAVRALFVIGESAEQLESELSDLVPTVRAAFLREAVEKAHSLARAGDVVLLSPACASFDQFRNYEERGRVFKTIVSELQ